MSNDRPDWHLDPASLHRLGHPEGRGHYRCGEAGRLTDGLWVVAWVTLAGDTVADATFEVYGSPAALILGNWLADAVIDCTCRQACAKTARGAVEALGLPTDAAGEAVVIEDALATALACEMASEPTGGSNEY